jgi:cytochrome P450
LKEAAFYDCFNTPHTLFAETVPELHRERRKRLNPLFSKRAIADFQPVIEQKVATVGSKIERLQDLGPIEVGNMFR